jgi:hypothetical protein
MKASSIFKCFLFFSAISLVIGCQKEPLSHSKPNDENAALGKSAAIVDKPQEHKIKGEYTAGYYSFEPDIAAGYVAPNPAPGWYPGAATKGHLNLLGKSQGFVNMYASFGPAGLQGTAASLNLFFADQLNAIGISLPDAVAIILFDKHGNSIWGRGIGTIPITPVSPTRVTFGETNAEILGGTGKFADATGSFAFSGYFNPQDTNDVGVEIKDGTIIY